MVNQNVLAKAATKAGMILLESGAETYRVEDTMQRICFSYGADVVDSYATPTLLIISFSIHNELCHNVKRAQIKNVDLTKIDRVNALARRICSEQLSVEAFNDELDGINQEKKYKNSIMIGAAAICTLGFALFFGGTLYDALTACIVGAFVKAVMIYFDKVQFNSFFKYLIASALASLGCIAAINVGISSSLDITSISVLMLLVPGLAITNAIRDTVSGDLVSGLTRTAEAFIVAISIAIGSGFMIMLLGGY